MKLKALETFIPQLVQSYNRESHFDLKLYPRDTPFKGQLPEPQVDILDDGTLNVRFPMRAGLLMGGETVSHLEGLVSAKILVSKSNNSASFKLTYSLALESLVTLPELEKTSQGSLILANHSMNTRLPFSLECLGISETQWSYLAVPEARIEIDLRDLETRVPAQDCNPMLARAFFFEFSQRMSQGEEERR